MAAAGAAKASGDGSRARLVPLLTSLGLLPLLASVLHGWVVRLQAERRHFGGADSAGGSPAAQLEQAGPQAAQQQPKGGQQQAQQQGAAAARDPAPHNAGGTGPRAVDGAAAAELEYDAESGGAVAAEISEPAAMEALALLEALAADVAGEAALNASGEAPPGGGACCERLGPGDVQPRLVHLVASGLLGWRIHVCASRLVGWLAAGDEP